MSIPLCQYFGKCGGCTSQQIDYPQQLQNKKQWIAKALEWESEQIKVFSGKEYFYRNRMDFLFTPKGLGLRRKENPGSIMPIEECVIATEGINVLLQEINSFVKRYLTKSLLPKALHSVIIRAQDTDSSICFVLNQEATGAEEATKLIKEFTANTEAKQVIATFFNSEKEKVLGEEVVLKGSGYLKEKFLDKTFFYSPQGFFQNNSAMAEKMLEYSQRILQKHANKNAHLLDLYGGVGTFGIVNARFFKAVSIVESYPPSIAAAKNNIAENQCQNIQALGLDAKQLRRVNWPKPLYVITDPPRAGMDMKVINLLRELQPEIILYISCNLQQLAKEIKKFKEYQPKSVALFDLFPQTPHVETMVELVKKNTGDLIPNDNYLK